jgi:hypothetical protein
LKPEIRVYVKSVKVPIGEELVEGLYPIKRGYSTVFRDGFYEVKRKITYGYVLPDDQNAVIEEVKRLSERYGFELRVIDVSKEEVSDPLVLLQRIWRRLKGIKHLPVVETNRRARLRAPFSQSELERFVSESAFSAN